MIVYYFGIDEILRQCVIFGDYVFYEGWIYIVLVNNIKKRKLYIRNLIIKIFIIDCMIKVFFGCDGLFVKVELW